MQVIHGGGLVDGSGSITTGGVSQQVFAATFRNYLIIQNISAGELWVNFGVAAVLDQPSFRLVAGASIEFSAPGTGAVPSSAVNIVGATTGQKFVAKQV